MGREHWPAPADLVQTPESLEEERRVNVSMITEVQNKPGKKEDEDESTGVSEVVDIDRFSSLDRFVRVTAWMRRFVHNVRAKKQGSERLEGRLSTNELTQADSEWVKDAQAALRKKGKLQTNGK